MALPTISSGLTGLTGLTDANGNPINQNGQADPTTVTQNPLPLATPGQPVPLQSTQTIAPGQATNASSAGTGTFDPNAALGSQVIAKAQTTALQGPQTQTQNMLSQQTQNLLADPNAGVNYDQYNQGQMESFDYNQQKALEAQRQKTADVSNTGQNMYDMSDLALKSNLDRSTLSDQLNQTAMNQSRANLVSALGEGRSTAATEQAGFNTQLSGLSAANQANAQSSDQQFQSEMKSFDASTQTALTELQGKISSGQLLQTQDFQAAQSALAQQFQKAMQSGDQAQQTAILQMQQNFQAQQTSAQQQYDNAQRVATESFTSSQTVSQQDFQAAQTLLAQKAQAALQSNDIASQQYIAQQQTNLQLAMQTNGFDQASKMAYLNAQIATAKASGDTQNALLLQNAQNQYSFSVLQSQQGHDVAMADLNNKLAQALQNNDTTNAESLQQQKFVQSETAHQEDLAFQNAQLQLQQKGQDISTAQANYENIVQAEQNGTAEPGAANAYLNQLIKATGVAVTAPNPDDQYKAIMDQYQQQQVQYLTSHITDGQVASQDDRNKIYNAMKAAGVSVGTADNQYNSTGNITMATPEMLKWAMANMPSTVSLTPTAQTNFDSFLNNSTYYTPPTTQDMSTWSAADQGTAAPLVAQLEVLKTDLAKQGLDTGDYQNIMNQMTDEQTKLAAIQAKYTKTGTQ